MILKQLIERVCKQILGIRYDVPEERLIALDYINLAAEEIWKANDLVGSLREDVFNILEDYRRISLPYYVEMVRGVRPYPRDGTVVKIETLRDKYIDKFPWSQYDTDQTIWRFCGITPTERDLGSATSLSANLSIVEDGPVNVTITGSTANADSVTETLTIPEGSTSVTSTKVFTPFPGIKAIFKDVETQSNVIIRDNASNQIAMIANRESEARNVIMEILECDETLSSACLSYQVLYKLRFTPFVSDYDVFQSEEYFNAIYYKAKALYCSDQEGRETSAALAGAKSGDLIKSVTVDTMKSTNASINYGPRRYHKMYRFDSRNTHNYCNCNCDGTRTCSG